jgi:hypothetical protein
VAAIDGWNGLPVQRWLVLVTVVLALALALAQAGCRSPAWPSSLSVIVTVLGALTTVALGYRLIATGASLKPGAFLGLIAAAGVMAGGFLSLREEGGWVTGREHPIETVPLGSAARR